MTTRRLHPLAPLGLALAGLLLAGCAPTREPLERLDAPAPPGSLRPQFVAVLTDGVAITGVDEGWRLTPGEPVRPPFRTDARVIVPRGENADRRLIEARERYAEAGARRVRVEVPGGGEPLHGLLLLGEVADTTEESSPRRSYRIVVPPTYVERARGSLISVVYQPYDFERSYLHRDLASNREEVREATVQGASWVLWLSDAPFASPAVGRPSARRVETP